MSDEERKLVERLQAFAAGLRDKPLPLLLANDPGPYQLPQAGCFRYSRGLDGPGSGKADLSSDATAQRSKLTGVGDSSGRSRSILPISLLEG